jgi:hypothetical protein
MQFWNNYHAMSLFRQPLYLCSLNFFQLLFLDFFIKALKDIVMT